MRTPGLLLYPFLAAAYPVLALAAANPSELPGLWVLAGPLGISLSLLLCVWLFLGAFIADLDKRAFLTFMFIVLFALYGYITIGLRGLPWAAHYYYTPLPVVIIAGYLGAITFLVFRLVPDSRKLTRYMTMFMSILVGWNVFSLMRQDVLSRSLFKAHDSEPPRLKSQDTPAPNKSPDIYLIVLDKYSSNRSLRDNFGFDNGDFEQFLRSRGFIVPSGARANYIYTMLSLASLLNYRYLDEIPSKPQAESRNRVYINHLIEDSAALRVLRSRHYRFIFFPTEFAFTAQNRFADLQLPNPRKIFTEFELAWRRTTLLEPVLSWLCQRFNCSTALVPFAGESTLLEWKFDQLRQVPSLPRFHRPLFVFAHLLVPHEPYVFNADCSTHPAFWPSFEAVPDETPEKQAYIAQIKCVNRQLETIVDRILRDSPEPPIILLQGDHGHGLMPLHIPSLKDVSPDRVADRSHLFAGYYLPGAPTGIISDSISVVNVFPTVFRQYFGLALPSLPDITYWSPWTNIFQMTRVQQGSRGPG